MLVLREALFMDQKMYRLIFTNPMRWDKRESSYFIIIGSGSVICVVYKIIWEYAALFSSVLEAICSNYIFTGAMQFPFFFFFSLLP